MIGMWTTAENRVRAARLQEAAASARKRGDIGEALEDEPAAKEIFAALRSLEIAEYGTDRDLVNPMTRMHCWPSKTSKENHMHRYKAVRILVAFLLAVALGSPLSANAVQYPVSGQMPIYGLSSPSGSELPLLPAGGVTNIGFQSANYQLFNVATHGIQFKVTSQYITGADGTLSNDFSVDYGPVILSDTDPSLYIVPFHNWRFWGVLVPQTYYYQFDTFVYGTNQHVASPVFSFVWNPYAGTTTPTTPTTPTAPTTPTVPSMSRSEAVSY
jgi:hypothetical protein